MYDSRAAAQAVEAHGVRLGWGVIKTLALALAAYWVARFLLLPAAPRRRGGPIRWRSGLSPAHALRLAGTSITSGAAMPCTPSGSARTLSALMIAFGVACCSFSTSCWRRGRSARRSATPRSASSARCAWSAGGPGGASLLHPADDIAADHRPLRAPAADDLRPAAAQMAVARCSTRWSSAGSPRSSARPTSPSPAAPWRAGGLGSGRPPPERKRAAPRGPPSIAGGSRVFEKKKLTSARRCRRLPRSSS